MFRFLLATALHQEQARIGRRQRLQPANGCDPHGAYLLVLVKHLPKPALVLVHHNQLELLSSSKAACSEVVTDGK